MSIHLLKLKLKPLIVTYKKSFLLLIISSSLGIMALLSLLFSYYTLKNSLDTYLQEYHYPDGIVTFTQRTLDEVEDQIKDIDGISQKCTRLIVDIEIEQGEKKGLTGRFYGYQEDEITKQQVLTSCDYKSNQINIAVDQKFAQKNNIQAGDQLYLTEYSQYVYVHQIVSSPESINISRNAYVSFELTDFGYIYISYSDLMHLLHLSNNVVNQLCYEVKKGYNKQTVFQQIQDKLKTNTIIDAYRQESSPVQNVIETSIEPLKTMTFVIPPLLFLVAVIFNCLFVSQIIKEQRKEIGLLLALGYNNHHVEILYTTFALLVSILSGIIGIVCGLVGGCILSSLYMESFQIPRLVMTFDSNVILFAFVVNIIFLLLGIILPVRKIEYIQPSDLMKIKLLSKHKTHPLLNLIIHTFSPLTKTNIHAVLRNKKRSGLTLGCLILSSFLILISLTYSFSLQGMFEQTYQQRYDYDCEVFLSQGYDIDILKQEIKKLNIEYQIEYIDVQRLSLSFHQHTEMILVNGINEEDSMVKLHNDNQQIKIRSQGIVLDENLATKLSIKKGDYVKINNCLVEVTDISKQNLNFTQYCSLQQANIFTNQQTTSNALLIKGVSQDNWSVFYDRISQLKGFDYCTFKQHQYQDAYEQLSQFNIGVYLIIFFALAIVFTIIYNMSLIQYIERKREFAIMKILGYTDQKIVLHSFIEIMIHFLIAGGIGINLGIYYGAQLLEAMNSELIRYYQCHTVVVIFMASALTFLFMCFGHLMAFIKMNKIDLCEISKEAG